MADFNPYQPPEAQIITGPHAAEESGVWRDGMLLVMTKGAELPDRCVKCNQPTGGLSLKRSLMWHSSIWLLLILFSPLIYIIAALIVRQTAVVWVPICPEHRSRRRWAIATGWMLSLLGLGVCFFAVGLPGYEGPIVLVGMILFLSGIISGVLRSQLAVPAKIDKRFVWLKKVHPDFLAELPLWS